jgi:hypothetical protein
MRIYPCRMQLLGAVECVGTSCVLVREYTHVEYTPMVCTPIVLWKNRNPGYNACMNFAQFVFRSRQYMHKEKTPKSKGSNRKHTKHR